MPHGNERVVWFNGKFLPESQVLVPFRDRSFLQGDAVYDVTRTFNGKAFRVEEHIDRLYRSLRYTGIDAGIPKREMINITEDVLSRNRHFLGPDDDFWVAQRVTRGVRRVAGDNWDHYGPNVIVECIPLPFSERAQAYRDGMNAITSTVRRVAPDALSPRAKMHNYMNLIMAEREVKAHSDDAWAVMLDVNGNLCEGLGANIFLVRDGCLATPKERFVLPGISRQVTIELAGELGIDVTEDDLDLYDAYTADECFFTSTSFCICPVRSLNGNVFSSGTVPGPVTKRLIDAYVKLVGCDFVQQYLKRLEAS